MPAKKQLQRKNRPEIYLKRMSFLLRLLGRPDKDFQIIHIAGTAGKGSVANVIQSILSASGQKTGLYTSPYATTSMEKIKVDGLYISHADFAKIVNDLKPHINLIYRRFSCGAPSYFEIFLAIALIYFQRQKCRWVVLETGLGGRYDPTNFVEKPIAAAITNIDYDHTDILGKTLRQIAIDKAGIIKKNGRFFTAEQRPKLLKIFKKICEERGADFYHLKNDSAEDYHRLNRRLAIMICRHYRR
ncbi:MAG: dihydrofolate synthase / folylpolyglutamate synthase [Candidatus Berkelbacteria bacterium Licking1014_2]|uniref:Dihydrofolate synthase / folylpolyglutamate synthase n=1 Tax=Candidatus Berkelbacteria bacterium Licking1014_2 TaxID=2017146 RepID=A0A554LT10_9BACT|nr:MAG: dihydrofolate synthase / folylpolyglutamate synthase [Candidatus Berkelbacteria bacterium Licking1014_2]